MLSRIEKAAEPFEFAEEKPYDYLAISLAALGDFEGASKVAHRIGKDPVAHPHAFDPSAKPWVLATIGAYQGKAGGREPARLLFREALELVRQNPKLATRLGQIALSQAEAGDLADAIKTLESVDPEERVAYLGEIAETRTEAGDREGTLASFRLALAQAQRNLRNLPPEPSREPSTNGPAAKANGNQVSQEARAARQQRLDEHLAQIAAFQAKTGDFRAARATFDTITLADHKGTAALAIAAALARAGDAEGALAWALALKPPSASAWALRGLAAGVLLPR